MGNMAASRKLLADLLTGKVTLQPEPNPLASIELVEDPGCAPLSIDAIKESGKKTTKWWKSRRKKKEPIHLQVSVNPEEILPGHPDFDYNNLTMEMIQEHQQLNEQIVNKRSRYGTRHQTR